MGSKLCVYESGLWCVVEKLCMRIMTGSKKEIYIYTDF